MSNENAMMKQNDDEQQLLRHSFNCAVCKSVLSQARSAADKTAELPEHVHWDFTRLYDDGSTGKLTNVSETYLETQYGERVGKRTVTLGRK